MASSWDLSDVAPGLERFVLVYVSISLYWLSPAHTVCIHLLHPAVWSIIVWVDGGLPILASFESFLVPISLYLLILAIEARIALSVSRYATISTNYTSNDSTCKPSCWWRVHFCWRLAHQPIVIWVIRLISSLSSVFAYRRTSVIALSSNWLVWSLLITVRTWIVYMVMKVYYVLCLIRIKLNELLLVLRGNIIALRIAGWYLCGRSLQRLCLASSGYGLLYLINDWIKRLHWWAIWRQMLLPTREIWVQY